MENISDIKMADIFQPSDTVIELGENKYRLVFDMLAFCELEKMYGSVDTVLKMLFGEVAATLDPVVTYNGAEVMPSEILVDGKPLNVILQEKATASRKSVHSDTLNIIWAGMLHDNAIYNDMDEIAGYKVSKLSISREITLKNYARLNVKIIEAILKDLAPGFGAGDQKNDLIQTETEPLETQPIQLVKTE